MTLTGRRWFHRATVTALFAALTLVMTWPQAAFLATRAADHHDVYFNLWRLRWIAHALASGAPLFDANVFHPAEDVLAFSDAMLVEGLIAAPMLLAGLPPVLVHNLLLLGAMAASGVGMFVLAERLSGSRAGAAVAGALFAYAPYRFEHFMHMELQWAVWIPWTFWALQRTIDSRSMRDGVLTGVLAGLQMLSSIYYGMFLGVLLPLVAGVQLLAQPRQDAMRTLRALAAGAAIAAAVAAAYSVPYSRASARVGERGFDEVTRYSARPADYLDATESNLLYGGPGGRPERRLSPGAVAPLLALAGLLLLPAAPAAVAYLIGGVAAFELSLGTYGLVQPWLYGHVESFQALRAPARASIFVLACLGVLAARGCAAVQSALPVPGAVPAGAVLVLAVLLECWAAPVRLAAYPNAAPPLYAWLARQPPGVVAHFPMPTSSSLPGHEAAYAYMSTFHWKPLLNGYSGYYPPAYLRMLGVLERFPEGMAIERLRASGVRYVIVHEALLAPAEYARIAEGAVSGGLIPALSAHDGIATATVFTLR